MAIINTTLEQNDTVDKKTTCSQDKREMKKKNKKQKQVDDDEKQRVRFNSRVKFRRDCTSLSYEERQNAWYNCEEIAAMRLAERKLRAYLSNDEELCKINSENMCLLGLRTDEEKKFKSKVVKNSIIAVLAEQLEQEKDFLEVADDDDLFFLDFESIAYEYSFHSQEAAAEALERGLRKARHVQGLEEKNKKNKNGEPSAALIKSYSKPNSTMQDMPSRQTFTNAAA